MSETNPNAYLVEAAEKRIAAGNLIAIAEDYEQRARDAGLEVPGDAEAEAEKSEQNSDNSSRSTSSSKK